MAHDLARLKQLIRQGDVAFVNWKRIERTLRKLDWINDPDQGEARVHQVIMGLVHEECFQKVALGCKCEHNVPVGQDRFDANQYEIHWDVEEGVRRDTPCDGTLSFSIKLTEVVDDNGPYCGIVTFHLSPDL
ncbi:hypothetical protein C6Q14_28215 [Burkholderia ambifaria]|jgi:hypothetical protein|uniref:hypothetical protein n=1 Tax=Burkholderia ambifaria TaxID=152480 RepID=UPI000D0061E6|nr:hypothetical protein [Burkholderia ambifaria]PRF97432.1 hypothetical protein C6Q14_28215 [Burkholderia ambifaria]